MMDLVFLSTITEQELLGLYKILFNKYIHNYVEREIQLVGRE